MHLCLPLHSNHCSLAPDIADPVAWVCFARPSDMTYENKGIIGFVSQNLDNCRSSFPARLQSL